MAQRSTSASVATLKSINIRLNSAPAEQLPQIVTQASGLIWNCRDLLSLPESSGKRDAEASTVAHHFKTRLSTLLQDRTVEGRWSATVLVKAAIEAGGVETLSKSNAWVRGLLGILKKRNDPSTTRTLAVVTLTRIFMLTWDYSNLVREITTPALPTFISSCLACADNPRCSDGELQTVLEAFSVLVPRHPTVFRTKESQIRAVLARIMYQSSSTSSPKSTYYTKAHTLLAQELSVSLHYCKPKQGASEQWESGSKSTTSDIHETCDRLFRSIIEDWRSTSGVQRSASVQQTSSGDLELPNSTTPGSQLGWKGVYAGSERLRSLLGLLSAHLRCATDSSVTVRIGAYMDMLNRLFSLTVPQHGKQEFVKPNHEISRDERDALFTQLPSIHIEAFNLVQIMLARFGTTILSAVPSLQNHATSIFVAERSDISLRTVAYDTLRKILALAGASLSKEDIATLVPVLRGCCDDLLPADEIKERSNLVNGIVVKQSSVDSSSISNAARPTSFSRLNAAASALLPMALSKLNAKHTSKPLRAQMDRTAVLTRHKDALLASVLNPPTSSGQAAVQPSLLPVLARLFPQDAEVEALIRPRMPVIRTGRGKSNEEEDEELDYYEDEDKAADEASHEEVGDGDVDVGGAEEPVSSFFKPLDSEDGATTRSVNHTSEQDTAFTTAKRSAELETGSAIPAKRLRASPVAETLLSSIATDLPGPNPATASAGLPGTVVFGQQEEQQTLTMPSQPAGSSRGTDAAPTAAAEMDLDSDIGSDFEMPPLTMGADSDDEEDEEIQG